MIVYPLTDLEAEVIRWASRILPVVAGVIVALLGTVSIASVGS